MTTLNHNGTTKLKNGIVAFFYFALCFTTFRILVVGSATSQNAFQYLISSLPELFIFVVLMGIVVQKRFLFFKTVDYVVLGFAAINIIYGTWLAHDIKLSLYAIRLTYLPVLFYSFGRSIFITSEVAIENAVSKIMFSTVLLAVIGIILYFVFPSFTQNMIGKAGGVVDSYFIVRMTSVLWTPVVFGTIMAIAVIFYYYKILRSFSLINYCFLLICLGCVLLSVSRGPLLALLIGLIVLSIWAKNLKSTLYMLAGFIVLFFAVAFYVGSPLEYIKWLGTSTADTMNLGEGVTRVKLWKMAFAAFKHQPFGYGLGKAGHVAFRFMKDKINSLNAFSTDGWYLKLADETGIIGLLTFLIMEVGLFILLLKKTIKTPFSFITFLFIFFIIMGLQNMVSNVWDFYWVSDFYWLLIGMAINIIYFTAND